MEISNLRIPGDRPTGGVTGREALVDQLLEGGDALFVGFAFLVVGAGLVVEMALAGDIGILQRVGPGAELPGAAFGNGFQI